MAKRVIISTHTFRSLHFQHTLKQSAQEFPRNNILIRKNNTETTETKATVGLYVGLN